MHALHMHTHTYTYYVKCVCFSEVCLMKQALGRGAASEQQTSCNKIPRATADCICFCILRR